MTKFLEMETRLVVAGIRNVRWAQDTSGMVIKGNARDSCGYGTTLTIVVDIQTYTWNRIL